MRIYCFNGFKIDKSLINTSFYSIIIKMKYFLYLDNLNIKFYFLSKRDFEITYLTKSKTITKKNKKLFYRYGYEDNINLR